MDGIVDQNIGLRKSLGLQKFNYGMESNFKNELWSQGMKIVENDPIIEMDRIDLEKESGGLMKQSPFDQGEVLKDVQPNGNFLKNNEFSSELENNFLE